jgi:hypothetical protein
MAYEQDARQMLISRLRNVYADEGSGVTGGKVKRCPKGFKRGCVEVLPKHLRPARKKKPKQSKAERNRQARVRYHLKKPGVTLAQAEALADGKKKTVKRKTVKRKTVTTKKRKVKRKPVKKGKFTPPCGSQPWNKWQDLVQLYRDAGYGKHSMKAASEARCEYEVTGKWPKIVKQHKLLGQGLRYNPNYSGPGHMDGGPGRMDGGVMMDSNYGGVMVDSDYGGVLVDAFYDM